MGVTFDDSGGIRIPGTLRHSGNVSPDWPRTTLAQQSLEEFTIPLENCLAHQRVANGGGIGITGTADKFLTSVEKVGQIIKTTILIDVDGLNSGGTIDDIVGADGAGAAYLTQITAAVNGTIYAGKITCLQVPTGGDPDIDLYAADEATGVEDTLVTALTQTQLINHGDWTTVGSVDALTAMPAANQYLYLATGAATDATYTAGVLLIELYGFDAAEDLAVVRGAVGTNAISLQTEDLHDKGSAQTRYARFSVTLPPNYVAGQTVKIRVKGGMVTTVADTTATVDVNCYLNDEDNTVSSDICTTTATSINSLIATPTTTDFVITASSLSPGDVLDVQVAVAINDDNNGASVVIGCISQMALLCDTQG
jgi:hypothetical protein